MNASRPPHQTGVTPPAGIYLHWPYCLSKCTYCDFVTAPERRDQPKRYASALLQEIKSFDPKQFPDLATVDTVYWGGGTPSLMPLEVLDATMDACRSKFQLATDTEVTLEANPGTLSREKLEGYRRLGVNRMSLGIESFHDVELMRLNRGHSVQQALETFNTCRDAGFDNINCDLICGLPWQTRDQWDESVRQIIRLLPEHISVYLLELHAGTRMFGEVMSGKAELPAEEDVVSNYNACVDAFVAAGYEHYEISNFARNGRYARHNLKYWDDVAYVGFGAGSHFCFGGARYRNEDRIEKYISRVQDSGSGIAEVIALDFEHWLGDFAITALRKRKGIDLENFRSSYGFSFEEYYREPIERMIEQGMLQIEDGHLRLTRDALLVSNEVFQEFI